MAHTAAERFTLLEEHDKFLRSSMLPCLVLQLKVEDMVIANALQLEAARSRAVPIRFNSSPVPSLNSPSLSAAVLERFYCLYVTLRCDLEL